MKPETAEKIPEPGNALLKIFNGLRVTLKTGLVTEDLAKTKWCPLLRFEIGPVNSSAWQGVAYTNRGEELKPPESCCCIASDCMMWVIHYRDGKALGYCGLVKQ